MSDYIHFFKEGEGKVPGYLRQTEAPYIIGKITKLRKQDDADNYAAKQVHYYKAKLDGFNIFITEAGFYKPPDRRITDVEIKEAIDGMCVWYYENHIKDKGIIHRLYKTKI